MRFFNSLYRWLTCYLLVIATILACFWENSLTINYTSHAILWIATLIFSGILINLWLSANAINLLANDFDEENSKNKQAHHDDIHNEQIHPE
jgi:hypothetical protein